DWVSAEPMLCPKATSRRPPEERAMAKSIKEAVRAQELPGTESRIPVDLPILILAGTDDPVGGKTRTPARGLLGQSRSDQYIRGPGRQCYKCVTTLTGAPAHAPMPSIRSLVCCPKLLTAC